MLALRELQLAFKGALLDGGDEAVIAHIDGDGLDPRARLAVYRHHVRITLTAVLESAYPVLCRLVDRRFFAYAADAFIKLHPPAGPCLAEYGRDFPDFLAGFPACGGHPYLPDVARLEWAVHQASQAAGAVLLDQARLRAVAPADMPRLRFSMDPGLTYLASPWPVDKIWRAHQDDGELAGRLDLGSGGVSLEVRATSEGVSIRPLEPTTYVFRGGLGRRLTLEQAATAALLVDPSFDLVGAIQELLEARLITNFTLTSGEGEST